MLHEILLILNGLESDPVGYMASCGSNLHAGEKDLVQKCLELGALYRLLCDYVSPTSKTATQVGLYEISIRSLLKKRLYAYMDCLIQMEMEFVQNRMGSVRFWLETLEPWKGEFSFWKDFMLKPGKRTMGLEWFSRLYELVPLPRKDSDKQSRLAFSVQEVLVKVLMRQLIGIMYESDSEVIDPFDEFVLVGGLGIKDSGLAVKSDYIVPDVLKDFLSRENMENLCYVLVAALKIKDVWAQEQVQQEQSQESGDVGNSLWQQRFDGIRDDFVKSLQNALTNYFADAGDEVPNVITTNSILSLKGWLIAVGTPLLQKSFLEPSLGFWYNLFRKDIRIFADFLGETVFWGDLTESLDLIFSSSSLPLSSSSLSSSIIGSGSSIMRTDWEIEEDILGHYKDRLGFSHLLSFKVNRLVGTGIGGSVCFDWRLDECFEWILMKDKYASVYGEKIQAISRHLLVTRQTLEHMPKSLASLQTALKDRMTLCHFITSLYDYYQLVVHRELKRLSSLDQESEEEEDEEEEEEEKVEKVAGLMKDKNEEKVEKVEDLMKEEKVEDLIRDNNEEKVAGLMKDKNEEKVAGLMKDKNEEKVDFASKSFISQEKPKSMTVTSIPGIFENILEKIYNGLFLSIDPVSSSIEKLFKLVLGSGTGDQQQLVTEMNCF